MLVFERKEKNRKVSLLRGRGKNSAASGEGLPQEGPQARKKIGPTRNNEPKRKKNREKEKKGYRRPRRRKGFCSL